MTTPQTKANGGKPVENIPAGRALRSPPRRGEDTAPDPEGRLNLAIRPWWLTAWISGVFSLLVAITMVVGEIGHRPVQSLTSPELADAKAALRNTPNDEQTKKVIRELDLRQRRQYFRQLSRMHTGVFLLLGGVAVFLIAASRVAHFRKQPPIPGPKLDSAADRRHRAEAGRWSVAASGTVLGALLFVLGLSLSSAVPDQAAEVEKLVGSPSPAAVENDAAAPQELRKNWPRFRGFEGAGVASFTNVPKEWDVKTGNGVLWKAPVPAKGFNSPICWGDRIFFSGGDAKQRDVFCLDAKTGQTLWRQDVTSVPGSPAQPPEIPDTTGYAACTMATDGKRVYVVFANGDVIALSFEGKTVWSKSFGPLKNAYGFATSLATWKDRLILQLDQGDSEEGKSKLYALDGRTGQIVWQKPRKVGSSWATPIVFEAAGRAQIIALAVPWVIAYAATDGSELWRVDCLSGEITPSPIFAGGLVIVPSPSDRLVAIRPEGQGDITKTGIAWTNDENVPDVTSPVSNGEQVFSITTPGFLTCFDIKTGKKVWEHDFDMEVHASPAIAGNRLYVFGQKGVAVVVEAAAQFKEIYRTEMGDAFHASPAFLDGKMILRGTTNIWCLGEKSSPGK
jgi:outer membrane protein assembly factor BamB